jgi:deoxyribose-phosphate aldolase
MKPAIKAKDMTVKELAAYIDQSVLKPEFTQEEIRKYIQEGIDFGCITVCVNPASVDIADELCKGTDTKICVVCDFPFGLSTTESKAHCR